MRSVTSQKAGDVAAGDPVRAVTGWCLVVAGVMSGAAALVCLSLPGFRVANCLTPLPSARQAAVAGLSLALVSGVAWGFGRVLGLVAGPSALRYRWWVLALLLLLAVPLSALMFLPISPAAAESRAACTAAGGRSLLAVLALWAPFAAALAGELVAARRRVRVPLIAAGWVACAVVAIAVAWVLSRALGPTV